MPKIVFTETRVVQDEHVGTDKETCFKAGFAYDLPEGSAQRWINRGIAVRADAAPSAPVAASAPAPAPAPSSTVDGAPAPAATPEPDAPRRRRAKLDT